MSINITTCTGGIDLPYLQLSEARAGVKILIFTEGTVLVPRNALEHFSISRYIPIGDSLCIGRSKRKATYVGNGLDRSAFLISTPYAYYYERRKPSPAPLKVALPPPTYSGAIDDEPAGECSLPLHNKTAYIR